MGAEEPPPRTPLWKNTLQAKGLTVRARMEVSSYLLNSSKFVEQPSLQGLLETTEPDLLVLHCASLFLVLATTTS